MALEGRKQTSSALRSRKVATQLFCISGYCGALWCFIGWAIQILASNTYYCVTVRFKNDVSSAMINSHAGQSQHKSLVSCCFVSFLFVLITFILTHHTEAKLHQMDSTGQTAYSPPADGWFDPVTFLKGTSVKRGKHQVISLPNLCQPLPSADRMCPQRYGMAWTSLLPASKQSCHWDVAEHSARTFLQEVIDAGNLNGRGILRDATNDHEDKERELVQTAAWCTVNVHCNASKEKSILLSKLLVIMWLHDDITEDTILSTERTILETDSGSQTPMAVLWDRFSKSFILSDPVWGPEVIASLIEYARHTRTSETKPTSQFESFEEYLGFRWGDLAAPYLLAAAGYSCSNECACPIEPHELKILNRLTRIYARHSAIANDLSSFPREYREREVYGTPLCNAVDFVHCKLGLPYHQAAEVVQLILRGYEEEFYNELDHLWATKVLEDRHIHYIQKLTDALTGNLFFAATNPRYVVPSKRFNANEKVPTEQGE